MTIIHINFSLTIGGLETMLVDIVNEQCVQANVHLVIINEQIDIKLLELIDTRVKVWRVGRPCGSRNPFYLVKLNRILFTIKPNAIHCHNHQIARWLSINKRHCYLTIHDIQIPVDYFSYYHKLFAISSIVQQDVLERSGRASQVIYNGVHTKCIKLKKSYTKDKIFRIVQVSRLVHHKKGQDILLEALNRLVHLNNIKTLHVDFIGEGESLFYLKNLTKKYKLDHYVNFVGLKTRSELYKCLNNYHLLVQPSLYEGFGLTVVEAMAAGVPVLVSNIDGPIELIDYGEYGYAFPAGDSEILAEQICNLISMYETETVYNKAISASQHARHHFDIQRTAKQYLTSYT